MNIYDLLIVQPIFNLLTLIYSFMPNFDFGLSVILFTIIIRILIYPLVRRQLHQTKMMRKLQPELKRIKQANKGNRQAEALQMMELYKKHGVSPFRSIGILLIQLPIFIGLYHAIQIFTLHRTDIAKYTYDSLESLPAIQNLIKHPDQFNNSLLGIVDLTKHAIGNSGIDIVLITLALLSAWTQYLMMRQTMPKSDSKKSFGDIMREASAGKQADQSEINAVIMQKMVTFMPFMMLLIMISLPGAIALYYTVSNLVALAQQSYLLRQDEDELEDIAEETTKSNSTQAQATKKTRTTNKKPVKKGTNVTRIVASDTKRRKR